MTGRVLFFFQAEDGIRDSSVTGVQTCALPISPRSAAADLDADLGGLAPNGHGPTKLKGGVQLGGVRFAAGAPFDAALDSDVDGDFDKGDLDVRKLLVTVAHMGVAGHGKLRSLDKQPRFEDFSVETRGVDFDALRTLYPALDPAARVT